MWDGSQLGTRLPWLTTRRLQGCLAVEDTCFEEFPCLPWLLGVLNAVPSIGKFHFLRFVESLSVLRHSGPSGPCDSGCFDPRGPLRAANAAIERILKSQPWTPSHYTQEPNASPRVASLQLVNPSFRHSASTPSQALASCRVQLGILQGPA